MIGETDNMAKCEYNLKAVLISNNTYGEGLYNLAGANYITLAPINKILYTIQRIFQFDFYIFLIFLIAFFVDFI